MQQRWSKLKCHKTLTSITHQSDNFILIPISSSLSDSLCHKGLKYKDRRKHPFVWLLMI